MFTDAVKSCYNDWQIIEHVSLLIFAWYD